MVVLVAPPRKPAMLSVVDDRVVPPKKRALLLAMDDHVERLVVVDDHVTLGDAQNSTIPYSFLLIGVIQTSW
jgi:hypothetical protein